MARAQRAIVFAVVAIVAVACADGGGGDGDESANDTLEPAEQAAFCETAAELATSDPPELPSGSTAEQVNQAFLDFYRDTVVPLTEQRVVEAPPAQRDVFDRLDRSAREFASTGDSTVLATAEVREATQAAHAVEVETCGWTTVAVTAGPTGYDGVPATLPPGITDFQVTNAGGPGRVGFSVYRRLPGATPAAADLLALPSEARQQALQRVDITVVDPGQTAFTVTRLEPGAYVVASTFGVGATAENPSGNGAPQYRAGFVGDISVPG